LDLGGVVILPNELIGQIKLDISQLQQQINEINRQLGKINNGQKNINLKVNIAGNAGGISNIIQETIKYNKAGEELYRTQKRMEHGFLAVYKKMNGGEWKRHTKEIQNASKEFNASFNSIINGYNRMGIAERAMPSHINKTIASLRELRKGHESSTNEYKRMTAEIKRLETARAKSIATTLNSKMGRSDYANQGFNNMLQQYKTQQMSMQQFIQKAGSYKDSGAFNLMSGQNQLRLMKELKMAQADYNKSVQSVNYAPIQKQLDIYNKLSKAQQEQSGNIKKIVSAYDTLIAKYKREGKEVSSLISERKKYANLLETQRNKELSTSKYSPIQQEINAYKLLSVEQQKQPANIQKIVSAYDKLIAQYQREKKDITGLIAERSRYNKLLSTAKTNAASTKFQSEFNTIVNGYNSMDKAQKKNAATIDNTIGKLKALQSQYKKDTQEYARLTTQINRLQTAKDKAVAAVLSSKMTRADYANQGLKNLLHQLKIERISLEQFMNKAMTYKQPKVFNMLTDSNQVTLTNALSAAEAKNTKIINENTRAKQKNQAIDNFKPVQNAINSYNSLNAAQKRQQQHLEKIGRASCRERV
jgi:hypothetical protein